MIRRRLHLITAAALAAGMLALTGCQPTTGAAPAPVGAGQTGCDPAGWGPLSGCDTQEPQQPAPVPAGGDTGCDPAGWGPLADDCAAPQADSLFVPDPGVDPAWIATAARHEAGHKAAADEYGWPVASVDIYPDGSGYTSVWGFRWKDPQQRVVLLLAGEVASGTSSGTGKDRDEIDEITAAHLEVDPDAAYAEAIRIVTAHADQIDQDAAVLRDEGHLS